MKNPFLIGARIYLRTLERADAPALQPWFNDPDVTRMLRRCLPINLQAEEKFIDHVNQGDSGIGLAIVVREGDRLIGVTGLMNMDYRNRHCEFGITIGDKVEWGKGYGSEGTRLIVRHAFATLNFNRVWLHVYEYNPRGIRCYERLGFRREGVLRQENFRDGRYWDTIVMGMLREEWGEK